VVPKSSRIIVTVHSAIKPRGGSGAGEGVAAAGETESGVVTNFHCSEVDWYPDELTTKAAAAVSRKPVYMVLGCTVFAGLAQIMMKYGAEHPLPPIVLLEPASLWVFTLALWGNFPLIAGYALSACNALLLILALRDGELSVLYPIYSVSYVWVILLSMYFFNDHLNIWKSAGVLLIMGGVTLLGKVSSKP
jgi:uncharacterized membrane protein